MNAIQSWHIGVDYMASKLDWNYPQSSRMKQPFSLVFINKWNFSIDYVWLARNTLNALIRFAGVMDWLEKFKKEHHENEAITNDVVAQAYLENYALKLFTYADQNDRAANFNK